MCAFLLDCHNVKTVMTTSKVIPFFLCISLSYGLENYLFTSATAFHQVKHLIQRPDVAGVQIVYNWKQLEKSKGKYDFKSIEKNLALLRSMNRGLFIQIQDRFFTPEAKSIPKYLLTDHEYGGGLIPQQDNPGEGKAPQQGWVAMQWNKPLRKRFQCLLAALAKRFDGQLVGINLAETAIDIDMKNASKTGFSCDKYFCATIDNLLFAKKVFKKSHVVQYVNFWPCGKHGDKYMSRLFALARRNSIGLGGPDIVPFRKAQMRNSYKFFHAYKGKLTLVAMAVQEPTLTYINSQTNRSFTKDEFINFADQYLGVNIIFWTPESPWLKH